MSQKAQKNQNFFSTVFWGHWEFIGIISTMLISSIINCMVLVFVWSITEHLLNILLLRLLSMVISEYLNTSIRCKKSQKIYKIYLQGLCSHSNGLILLGVRKFSLSHTSRSTCPDWPVRTEVSQVTTPSELIEMSQYIDTGFRITRNN
jgi:hypothetical protein